MAKNNATDFKLRGGSGISGEETWSVVCTYKGARYHIWISSVTFKPTDNKLYKNPIGYLKRHESGYFQTRILKQDEGVGAVIVPRMLNAAPFLAPKHREELEGIEKARLDKVHAAYAIQLAQEAGPELLRVIKLIDAEWRSDPMATQCFDKSIIAAARSAIAKTQVQG